MSAELASEFVFTLCQPGAERALKRELARLRPDWRPAQQRPGMVTFLAAQAVDAQLALESVFARQHGLSLGSTDQVDDIVARVKELPAPLCLQVVERALHEPDTGAPSRLAVATERTLRKRCEGRFTPSSTARMGELVLSVIVAPQERSLLGLHLHQPGRCPHPGGRYPIALPNEAPSRAYLKIEEAIAHFELPLRPGDSALEIGSAPGGAAYALVRRGLHVHAVDPAAMDPRVLALAGPGGARVTHHALAVGALERARLPTRIDWLLMDVHLAPQLALHTAKLLASQLRGTLQGVVLTLKLNDWAFAERIESFREQARAMGIVEPRAKQLASHRQELALAGLTTRGLARVAARV